MGCAGPGLEPPKSDANNGSGGVGMMPIGGMGSGGGGTVGAGAGGESGMAGSSGSGGFGNSGSGGMGAGAGVPSGGTGGTGGFGGAGGAGGSSGTAADPDAGMSDGGAPTLDCEESREVVEVSVFGFPLTNCTIAATEGVLTHDDAFAVAITVVAGEETKWPERKPMGAACGEDEAFVYEASLDVPRIDLCPALCEAILAAQAAGVTVELIYGCIPPD